MYVKETYSDFLKRLAHDFSSGCLPDEPFLHVLDHGKIDSRGILLPFSGSTVVWNLNYLERGELVRLQREIAYPCRKILGCQTLPPDSFHVTLHDLVSNAGTIKPSAEALERLAQAQQVLNQAPVHLHETIVMRSWRMVSMVSKSIVLLLVPETEHDWACLSALYDMLQSVVPLDYPATPHITLAYYRPGLHDVETIRSAIHIPCEGKRFLLRPEMLVLQRFSDMAHYSTVQRAFPELG